MNHDDWSDALDTELQHADPHWAREARRTLLWRRAKQDLGAVLTTRSFGELLIISALPAAGTLITQRELPTHVFEWVHPLAGFLWTSGLSLLLTLAWLTRRVLRGSAPWVPALLAASLSTLPILLIVGTSLRGASDVFTLSTLAALLPLLPQLLMTTLVTFGLLITFGWALSTLIHPHRSVAP
ncbi:hypothetical protein [Deinococcus depolymerans]|uniref:Uncharacterized protein n=1 Tax=Deinococcus depolymerans TaxID=392408 RepID=A0ABN1BLB3_9DEIO